MSTDIKNITDTDKGIKVRYVSDLDIRIRLAIGMSEEITLEEWQFRLKIIELLFQDDCQHIQTIFEKYRTTEHTSDDARAIFLKDSFLAVYPDFVDNYARAYHTAWLMKHLSKVGHQIILTV